MIELILHKLCIFEAVDAAQTLMDEAHTSVNEPYISVSIDLHAPQLTPKLITAVTPHFDQQKRANQREKMEKIAKLAEVSKSKAISRTRQLA